MRRPVHDVSFGSLKPGRSVSGVQYIFFRPCRQLKLYFPTISTYSASLWLDSVMRMMYVEVPKKEILKPVHDQPGTFGATAHLPTSARSYLFESALV